MQRRDGRYVIVFNGEIYNYKELRQDLIDLGYGFTTESDTEVLLAAWICWGPESLARLKGMFAFSVYDRLKNTLSFARDAFGIKPLFYYHDSKQLVFASEAPVVHAMLQKRLEPNAQRAYDYLVFGRYDDKEATFFCGIDQLLPGHWMHVDLGERFDIRVERWWWPSIVERQEITFDDAAMQIREMFLSSVRLHMRSDVAIGAALSGGIDSSAIVCAMRHLEPEMDLHTFSYVARGSSINEEPWINLINDHVHAIPHKVDVLVSDLSTDIDDMVRAQGEPFGGTSIYAQYRVYQKVNQCGVTVILDGQGADELFGGYLGYPDVVMKSMLEQGEIVSALKFLRAWTRWSGRDLTYAVQAFGAAILSGHLRATARNLFIANPMPSWIDTEWLKSQGVSEGFSSDITPVRENKGRRLMEKLRSALTGHGLNMLLRHGDRNSMRWSVESRVPFLTPQMAEFVLTLPESYLVSPSGQTKHVFRSAMRGIVPDQILDRRDKIGFQTPENDWLAQDEAILLRLREQGSKLPMFDNKEIDRLFQNLSRSDSAYEGLAWRLVNFYKWHEINFS